MQLASQKKVSIFIVPYDLYDQTNRPIYIAYCFSELLFVGRYLFHFSFFFVHLLFSFVSIPERNSKVKESIFKNFSSHYSLAKSKCLTEMFIIDDAFSYHISNFFIVFLVYGFEILLFRKVYFLYEDWFLLIILKIMCFYLQSSCLEGVYMNICIETIRRWSFRNWWSLQ